MNENTRSQCGTVQAIWSEKGGQVFVSGETLRWFTAAARVLPMFSVLRPRRQLVTLSPLLFFATHVFPLCTSTGFPLAMASDYPDYPYAPIDYLNCCMNKALASFLSGNRDADLSSWEGVEFNDLRRQLRLDLRVGNFEGMCSSLTCGKLFS